MGKKIHQHIHTIQCLFPTKAMPSPIKICNSMGFWTSKNNKNNKDNNTVSSASTKKEQNSKPGNLHTVISNMTNLKSQSSPYFTLCFTQGIKWQLCGASKERLNELCEEKSRFMITLKNIMSNMNLDEEAEMGILNSEIACLKSGAKTLIPCPDFCTWY